MPLVARLEAAQAGRRGRQQVPPGGAAALARLAPRPLASLPPRHGSALPPAAARHADRAEGRPCRGCRAADPAPACPALRVGPRARAARAPRGAAHRDRAGACRAERACEPGGGARCAACGPRHRRHLPACPHAGRLRRHRPTSWEADAHAGPAQRRRPGHEPVRERGAGAGTEVQGARVRVRARNRCGAGRGPRNARASRTRGRRRIAPGPPGGPIARRVPGRELLGRPRRPRRGRAAPMPRRSRARRHAHGRPPPCLRPSLGAPRGAACGGPCGHRCRPLPAAPWDRSRGGDPSRPPSGCSSSGGTSSVRTRRASAVSRYPTGSWMLARRRPGCGPAACLPTQAGARSRSSRTPRWGPRTCLPGRTASSIARPRPRPSCAPPLGPALASLGAEIITFRSLGRAQRSRRET